MRDYFQGWKRKAGIVTLAMACLLAAGWVRSTASSDYIRIFPVQFHGVLIVSAQQAILVQVWSGAIRQSPETTTRNKPRKKKPDYQPERFGIHLDEELTRRMKFSGGIGTVFQPEKGRFERYHEFKAPYWAIVIPLTLISASFLLSKPPKTRSRDDTELKV